MNEAEYLAKYRAEVPALEAWGKFVIQELTRNFVQKFGQEKYDIWVKMPPRWRLKDEVSLITKAFVLDNGWFPDIYNDINDKVGVRYVVGLSSHISNFITLIKDSVHWSAISSREFDDWRKADPRIFDYQSAHFILRSLTDTTSSGVNIPAGTKCEVQIRTLLQHAYAELSHETLYKTNIKKIPEVHRLFAKSMALMEATDDMLLAARSSSNKTLIEVEKVNEQLLMLNKRYLSSISFASRPRENDYLISSLTNILPTRFEEKLEAFVASTASILIEKITLRQKNYPHFQVNAITLVYFLAKTKKNALPSEWPFERESLDSIYSDLGIAPPGSAD